LTDKKLVREETKSARSELKTGRAFIVLVSRGHSGLWVWHGGKRDMGQEFPSMKEGGFDPLPTNAEVAIATKPVRVNPTSPPRLNDLHSLSGEIEGGNSEKEPETGESSDGTHLRLL
jgi:hypothetical protein